MVLALTKVTWIFLAVVVGILIVRGVVLGRKKK
jgi:hypothetical protein